MTPKKQSPFDKLMTGPFTGAEASDGFTSEADEERALQEEADAWTEEGGAP